MEEIFTFTKKNGVGQKVLLPIDYDKDESSIPGVYFTSSIRFYKNRIDSIDKEFFKNTDLTPLEIKKYLRIIYASMADFKIQNNEIYLKGTGTIQDKYFDFKRGIIIAKCNKFMDVIEKVRLEEYLDLYGFEKEYKDEILSSESSSFKRTPTKKLKFFFMNNKRDD